MASVRKPPQRKGWQVRWRDGDGRRGAQHTRYFARREDAKLFRPEIEQALARGTYIDPKLGRITLAEWWERYFADADLAPSTRTLQEGHWRNHIAPQLSQRQLAAITTLCRAVAGRETRRKLSTETPSASTSVRR